MKILFWKNCKNYEDFLEILVIAINFQKLNYSKKLVIKRLFLKIILKILRRMKIHYHP